MDIDEFSGQLSLNLITEECDTFKRKRKKVTGDRSSRVAQRKAEHSKKPVNEGGNFGTDIQEKETWGTRGGKKRKKEDRDVLFSGNHSEKRKKKDTEVISSLFRKNPEVPNIPSIKVEAVNENVFTGDTFRDLQLHPFLVSNLEEKQGFKQMTEVQKQTIPVLMGHKDALVKSQTGSGKTLAYAVPIVQMLQSRKIKIRRDDGPYVLVIVPTRELALQSYDTFSKLLRAFVWIVPGCLMGGEKRKAEKSRLRKGVNVLVATPGRLMDHIKSTNVLSLARVMWLVIDEADRLLELGYERDIAQIINALRSQCPDPPQTVLLSATLTEGVERLSSITLSDPEHINIADSASHQERPAPQELKFGEKKPDNFSVPSQLKQYFLVTPCKLRLVTLAALVLWKCKYSSPRSKMIVFLSTQDTVEFHARLFSQLLGCKRALKKSLASLLMTGDEDVGDSSDEEGNTKEEMDAKNDKTGNGLRVFQLHGDMAQKERTKMYNEFMEATSGVLFCTDVAARGLDLPNVDWIVQYTSPGATTDYIHRVGRTARAGSKGQALLFLMPSETAYVQELNRYKINLTQMDAKEILQKLLTNISDLPASTNTNSNRQLPRTQEEAATFLQDRFEECLLGSKEMLGLAGKGFQSYIRAYATYSREVKDIFKVGDLHLGHVAKSFALREAPTKVQGVAAIGGGDRWRKKKEGRTKARPLSFKQAALSEFSAGIPDTKGERKKKAPGLKHRPKQRKKFQR